MRGKIRVGVVVMRVGIRVAAAEAEEWGEREEEGETERWQGMGM